MAELDSPELLSDTSVEPNPQLKFDGNFWEFQHVRLPAPPWCRIGAYQSARSRDQRPSAPRRRQNTPAAERVATVTLRLAVVNNSKFVRGRKRATGGALSATAWSPMACRRLDAGTMS